VLHLVLECKNTDLFNSRKQIKVNILFDLSMLISNNQELVWINTKLIAQISEKGLESKNKCVPLHSQTVSAGKFIERLQQKKNQKK
jgi:hypothetical protein